MIDNEVSFTSLCYITVDYEGRIWLNRLADVEDDILHTPFKSERTDNYFENRDRLYRNDGPTALGTVGIWKWTAIPNRDNPAIDYVQSYYVKDYSPVRVVVLVAKSLDEVVEQLQNGTARTQAYFCDTLFCYEPKWGQFAGVLCRANEFNISDRCAKLSETVYSLPSYTISSGDIYNWDDRNLRFLKTLQVGEPSGYVSIGNTDEVIRTLILERTTWPLFKECIGATKAEWKHCKLLLEKICGESLYDAIVQKLNCTLDQAKQTVDDFVNRADALTKVGDIDVNVLAEIAKNHDELRELCEKAVSVEWHNSHAAEIAKAEAEVSEMEETISIAKKQHSELLAEIATKQGELDRLLAEIAQYESIGKETLVAVRQKIADAQKDIAGFIADISVFLPQSNATLPYGNHPAPWQYSSASGRYSDEDEEIELAESWRNELGEVYFSDGNLTCKECGSTIYELYNDRRCGSIFFRGFVLKQDFEARRRTYLWHQPGMINEDEVKEIHLFIPSAGYRLPERQGQNKISPCYLDVQSGFIDFSDDSLDGKQGIRKLYYSGFTAKARPDILTFSTCPHCRHELSKMQLTSFNTRGNQSFFNLIKAQFQAQPAVPGKTGDPDRLPNEGRKVLLFSDSRQRAAKLARDMSDASDMTAARQLAVLAIDRMEHEVAEQSMNYFYDYFAMVAVEHHVQIFHDSETEKQRERLIEHGTQALKNYTRAKKRGQQYTPRFTIDNAPTQMKEQLIRFYCGGYNTLVDSALSWIEPTDAAKWDALDALEEAGVEVSEEEFMEFFNAWILSTCDTSVILGHTIPDVIREKVRPNYVGYGIDKNKKFSTDIREIMGWSDNDSVAAKWSQILRETFMDEGSSSNGKYYIDLSRIKPRFDLEHTWFRCERCSELTPYLLKGKCPSCQCEKIHPMTTEEIDALDFWRKPIEDALQGDTIRVIDTEEHTAQLSHKDQRDELWSRTEQYELRFQDFLQNGEAPVDILSSTTTMEVGIDIGSLVAVGLRNIPPMRENYQQRAGRAGRRGSSLSTIVTFCEDGPHDSLYFSNPVPMFRGDPRKPWIDISSEKITQRHLGMVALQTYLREKSNSLDAIPAIEFLDEHLQPFSRFLEIFEISKDDILVPVGSKGALGSYKDELEKSLSALKQKRDDHPELFETDDSSDSGKKSLLDALYEEGVIPTYSFPKNVVSTYISDVSGKVKYQVERGLDVAIGEYAPGRAIVVDKTTYQIGGLYYPGGERSERTAASPAKAFIQDASYRKSIRTCSQCGWFGLEEDNPDTCPFCGNKALTNMLPMLRPWGFAPRNATSIETAQLNEEYSATQQPLYSTLPDADDVTAVNGCANIRMAVRPNQRIIMLNNGVSGKGFTICCDCGAAMPGDDPAVLKDVLRPYRSKFIKTRCKHSDTINVNLGYDFVTDMLVLEFALDRQQIDTNPTRNSWLNRAGQSLAEGLRLAACQELDIEFTELVTGFRVRQNRNGDFVDIYLYDSLSSGAGYAVSIESSIRQLLTKTRELLEGCTCDSACHSCLKHYRNQYIHSVLDRKAALDLLNWGETGARVSAVPYEKQQYLLKSLEQILQISGIHIDVNHESVWAEGRYSKKKVVVYPAMWTKPIEENTIFVSDAHLKYAKPYALKTILDSL